MTREERRQTSRWLFVAAALLLGGCSWLSERRAIREAEASIRPWLALVDRGQYEAAWQQAAPELQRRSAAEEWANEVRSSRPAGSITGRTLVHRKYHDRLGTGPAGRYVNLLFQVFLEDGTTFGELTTVVESGEQWRVYGYRVIGARRAKTPQG